MRKKEILSFVTKWMDLQGIILGEISQIGTDYMISLLHEIKKKAELLETEENGC